MLDLKNIDQCWLIDKLKVLNLKVFLLLLLVNHVYTDEYSLFNTAENKGLNVIERIKGYIDIVLKFSSMLIIGIVSGKLSESGKNKGLEKTKGKLALTECLKFTTEKNVIRYRNITKARWF